MRARGDATAFPQSGLGRNRPGARRPEDLAGVVGSAAAGPSNEAVLSLQRTIGNAAVVQLLAGSAKAAPPVLQRGSAPSILGPGRGMAVRILQRGAPGTAAHVMLGPVQTAFQLLGNLVSGRIGQHYADVFPTLNQPASRRLLMRIAVVETRWWAGQPGLPGWFGSMMSARARAGILIRRAESMGLLEK